MLNLDIRTVLLSYTLCNLICAIVTFSLWRQNRNRFSGLGLCMVNFILNFLGILLLSFRGLIPDFFSIVVGNVLIVAGTLLLLMGLAEFLGIKLNQIHNDAILGLYIAFQVWLTYGYPDLQLRTILFSSVIIVYIGQMVWFLFKIHDSFIQSIVKELRIISIFYVLLGVSRIIYASVIPLGNDLLKTGFIEAYIFLGFEMIYVSTTFYFFLMVNKRLVHNLEADIQERKKTEFALMVSQEKFLKAFINSPDPMLITRLQDGLIIDANEAFERLVGHSRDEVLGTTTVKLGIWADPDERTKVMKHMDTFGRLREYEFLGINKNGQELNLVYSGETINLNNEKCLISILQDISGQKISERVVQIRLELWEYSANHTIIELMTKALDMIEELTLSKISFFHTVVGDGKDLVLQAWSTRTKAVFCKAEGENMHYALDRAGVWGDSVRERRPIIHNDYEKLENKKGLPEGHAPVKRELTVPIFYQNKIEAVLGVGNKEVDYNEKDVELIENVSGVVWTIIRQKQADDKILQLNEKLESLAMTDELTKIANRRAFFIRGIEEITRARRYHLPLSLIMLDIDRFKLINDTLGHDSGDYALQCVAALLVEGIREVDVVGRLGGEEFAVLLPNTKIEDAKKLAERLRIGIAENSDLKTKLKMDITASFGVAEYQLQIKNLDELLKNADTAMYRAKNSGRNRVELFTSELD